MNKILPKKLQYITNYDILGVDADKQSLYYPLIQQITSDILEN